VRRLRPLGQRVLVYWAAMTLGPLLLGASLALTSYAVGLGRLVGACPAACSLLLRRLLQFLMLAGGMAALYHYVPNTPGEVGPRLGRGLFVSVWR
jgi:membrane protein